jgi:hypothetical protein
VNVAGNIVGMLLEDQDWNFTTKLDLHVIDTDVTGLPENEAFIGGTAQVAWRLEIDAAEWGIKELSPILTSIVAHLTVDDYSQPDAGEQEMEIVYNVNEQPQRPSDESDPKAMATFYQGFTAEAQWNPARQSNHTHIYPTSLEIDLVRHHIVVHFG